MSKRAAVERWMEKVASLDCIICGARPVERWEWAPGWTFLYLVSDAGRVLSAPRVGKTSFGERIYGGKAVAPFVASSGYLAVNLTDANGTRRQELVHRMVLGAFVGPPPAGMECCHWDGNRRNPRLENLRWDTRANNHQDKKRHGTWQSGDNHWMRIHERRG